MNKKMVLGCLLCLEESYKAYSPELGCVGELIHHRSSSDPNTVTQGGPSLASVMPLRMPWNI